MNEMTPEEFMRNHPKGMNMCYWMLVTMNDRDLKSTQAAFEEYHQAKLKSVVLANVSQQRELLKTFCEYVDLESNAHSDDIKLDIENHIKVFNGG
jgi:hypothetical protein